MVESCVKVYKSIKISSIIFKPENLKELAAVLNSEFEKDTCEDNGCPGINFTFTTRYGTQYDGDFNSLFNGNYLQVRPINKVTMSYSNYRVDKSISLDIEDSSSSFFSSRSKCSIKGTNEQWVNGIKTTIEDILGSFEKRNLLARVIYKHDFISFLLILIALQFGLQSVFRDPISELMKDSKTLSSAIILLIALNCAALMVYFTIGKLFKFIFPEIELNVGQEHHQLRKRIRKASFFFIFILIPTILAVIGSLPVIKTYIHK